MSKLLPWLSVDFLEKWDQFVTDVLKLECSYSMPQTLLLPDPALPPATGVLVKQKVRLNNAAGYLALKIFHKPHNRCLHLTDMCFEIRFSF